MNRQTLSDDESVYLIWSIEHWGWWRPKRQGYTNNIGEAGWYLRDDTLDILNQANRRETMEVAIPLRQLSRLGA